MPFIRLKSVSLTMPFVSRLNPTTAEANDHRVHYHGGRARSFAALTGIDLTIEPGDRVGIVGPNGAGKTTLLRVIAGIFRPSFGEVHVQGATESLFSIGLGMRMDRSGWQNLQLRGRLRGLRGADLAAYIERCAAFADIGSFMDMPMRTYSQGMALRLMFAASTEAVPDILLLDEWIGAGDASFRERAHRRMLEFVEHSGIVVLSSHNLGLMKSVCNKVLWLHQGQVHRFGGAEEVINAYVEEVDSHQRQQRKPAEVIRPVASNKTAAA